MRRLLTEIGMRRFTRFAIIALAASLSLLSCKDKKDTTSKETLPTYPTLSLDEFAEIGDIVKFAPAGVEHPDGGTITWTAKVTAGSNVSETLSRTEDLFYYEFPDSLGAYTFTLTAADEDNEYYSVSSSAIVTVVRGGLNLPGQLTADRTVMGRSQDLDPESIQDDDIVTIDGETYLTVELGGNVWLRENLSTGETGRPYHDGKLMGNILGGYYSWEEAQTACPSGWKLPSDSDWVALAAALGDDEAAEGEPFSRISGQLMAIDATYVNDRMWVWWPRGDESVSGFDAIPCGYANLESGVWGGFNDYAMFWTSDEKDGEGVYRYMYVENGDVLYGTADKTGFGASVRCIKE